MNIEKATTKALEDLNREKGLNLSDAELEAFKQDILKQRMQYSVDDQSAEYEETINIMKAEYRKYMKMNEALKNIRRITANTVGVLENPMVAAEVKAKKMVDCFKGIAECLREYQ